MKYKEEMEFLSEVRELIRRFGSKGSIDRFNRFEKSFRKLTDQVEAGFYEPQYTFPAENEFYYTIKPDGNIGKKLCEMDKEDLYNIAHSNYYAGYTHAVQARLMQTGIMTEIAEKIRQTNVKEREKTHE